MRKSLLKAIATTFAIGVVFALTSVMAMAAITEDKHYDFTTFTDK